MPALQVLLSQFEALRGLGSKGAKEPSDAYNRKVVANWSAFFLTHVTSKSQLTSNVSKQYYDLLETPLRSVAGFAVRSHNLFKLKGRFRDGG